MADYKIKSLKEDIKLFVYPFFRSFINMFIHVSPMELSVMVESSEFYSLLFFPYPGIMEGERGVGGPDEEVVQRYVLIQE